MSEPAEASMMNVVPMSPRRSSLSDDGFAELFRGWTRLRDFDRPDLWVRRVAIRKAQREASRRTRRIALEQAATKAPPVEDGVGLPDPELIAAIRALPPKQRAIVVLFYLEDLPMDEVADLVGCSSSTGFVHLHHARHRLADLLGEEVDGHVH